jgi:hypothetical protein
MMSQPANTQGPLLESSTSQWEKKAQNSNSVMGFKMLGKSLIRPYPTKEGACLWSKTGEENDRHVLKNLMDRINEFTSETVKRPAIGVSMAASSAQQMGEMLNSFEKLEELRSKFPPEFFRACKKLNTKGGTPQKVEDQAIQQFVYTLSDPSIAPSLHNAIIISSRIYLGSMALLECASLFQNQDQWKTKMSGKEQANLDLEQTVFKFLKRAIAIRAATAPTSGNALGESDDDKDAVKLNNPQAPLNPQRQDSNISQGVPGTQFEPSEEQESDQNANDNSERNGEEFSQINSQGRTNKQPAPKPKAKTATGTQASNKNGKKNSPDRQTNSGNAKRIRKN